MCRKKSFSWIDQHTSHQGDLFYVHFNDQNTDIDDKNKIFLEKTKSMPAHLHKTALNYFLVKLSNTTACQSMHVLPEMGLMYIDKHFSDNFPNDHSFTYSNLKCGTQKNDLLHRLQGTYLTLQSLSMDAFNENVQNISVKLIDQVYRLHLFDYESKLLIIVLPELHWSSNSFADWLHFQLKFIFGNVDLIFQHHEHHHLINYWLELARHHLCSALKSSNNNQQVPITIKGTCVQMLKQPWPWFCQRFLLNRSLHGQVSKHLNKFANLLHKTTSHYQVMGSMMFYQALLLESHLDDEWSSEIIKYLQFHHLLNVDMAQQVELLGWKWVNPINPKNVDPFTLNPYFLIIVGRRSLLYCCLLRRLERNQKSVMPDHKLLNASLHWIVNQMDACDLVNQLSFDFEIQKHCYSLGLCPSELEASHRSSMQSSVWSRLAEQNHYERSSMDRVMVFVKQHLFHGLIFFLHLNTSTNTFARPVLHMDAKSWEMIHLINELTDRCVRMFPKLKHTDKHEYTEAFKLDQTNQKRIAAVLFGRLIPESSKCYFLCFNAKKLPNFTTCVDMLTSSIHF